jgi:hypothetical protein
VDAYTEHKTLSSTSIAQSLEEGTGGDGHIKLTGKHEDSWSTNNFLRSSVKDIAPFGNLVCSSSDYKKSWKFRAAIFLSQYKKLGTQCFSQSRQFFGLYSQ